MNAKAKGRSRLTRLARPINEIGILSDSEIERILSQETASKLRSYIYGESTAAFPLPPKIKFHVDQVIKATTRSYIHFISPSCIKRCMNSGIHR